jgi:hypothetical protein
MGFTTPDFCGITYVNSDHSNSDYSNSDHFNLDALEMLPVGP